MSRKSLNLVLNPSAKISIDRQRAPLSFFVEAPIKGASLSSVSVNAENFPGAHSFLCSILIDGDRSALIGQQDAVELRQIGLFAPADELPQSVNYRFPYRDHAIWKTLPSLATIDSEPVQCAYLSALRIPAEWPGQTLRFETYNQGSMWAPVLTDRCTALNDYAAAEHTEVRQQTTTLDDEATHIHFNREGFAILQNVLPIEHVREMGIYFQALAAEGFLVRRNDNGSLRFTANDHPVARFWHEQLNKRVSQLAGRPTKPSYSFVSLYVAGGHLYWHTDIPQCEYTVALLLDYTPLDAEGRSSWALKMEGRDSTIHSLHQHVGEALIFKGRQLSHGRDVLPEGHRSASLLFHFVNEDFEGKLG